MIKELSKLDFLDEKQVYRIANIMPKTNDDIKTIFAKDRITLDENKIKKILEIVNKYYIE
jgi:DNA-directed RNA polymerase subunit F